MGRCISVALPCRERTLAVLSNPAYSFVIREAISEVDAPVWDSLLPAEHLFLSRSYLFSLGKSTGSEVRYRYLLIYRDRLPVGAGFFQIIHFKGSNVERNGAKGRAITDFASRLLRRLLVGMINRISLNLLVSGNAFVTGEYGFYFSDAVKGDPHLFQTVSDAIGKIISDCKEISGILIKDYYAQDKAWLENLKRRGFLEFQVNPNMILDIKPSWLKFSDYLDSMTSKYRTRMKKAMKRAAPLTIREMNADELQLRLPQLSLLYDEVVDEAAFKLAKLNIEDIVRLKKELSGKFGIIGFFKDEKLVTFISYYLHETDLVAGYMGMNRSLNHQYDLYLNVLLKLAETGIAKAMKRVVYGRTAMEIKSSVGALPHPMFLYVKHRAPAVNFIIRQVVRYLAREERWTLRNPFKAKD